MRTLVKVQVPVQRGNKAIAEGTIGKVIGDFVERAKPEAAYFMGFVVSWSSIDGNNNVDASTDQWVNACSANNKNKYLTGYDYFPGKCQDKDSGATGTAPVASNPDCQSIDAAFQGVFDQQGNVAEWIDRCTGSDGSGDVCSTPGGDFEGSHAELSCGSIYALLRSDAQSPNINVGFRCCSDP